MARCPACPAIAFALACIGLAMINPRFTPRHPMEEAELMLAARIQPTGDPLEWQLTAATQIKGEKLDARSLRLIGPPRWKTSLRQAAADAVLAIVQAPPSTPAREARIYVQLLSAGNVAGEVTVPVRVARAGSPGA